MNIRPSAAICQNYNEIVEKIITGWFIKNKIKVSGIGESKTSQMPDFFAFFDHLHLRSILYNKKWRKI